MCDSQRLATAGWYRQVIKRPKEACAYAHGQSEILSLRAAAVRDILCFSACCVLRHFTKGIAMSRRFRSLRLCCLGTMVLISFLSVEASAPAVENEYLLLPSCSPQSNYEADLNGTYGTLNGGNLQCDGGPMTLCPNKENQY